MRTGTWVRGGATLVLMAASVAVLSGSSSPAASSDARTHPAICHPTPPIAVTAPEGSVTATIPRLVVVRLDRDGHPTRLWTNTGSCPRGDERVVVERAGQQGRAPRDLRREIARHVYRGDWSQPGVWHSW